MRLGKYVTPLAWTIVIIYLANATALLCWECESVKNPDCGHKFHNETFEPVPCKQGETTCALQRQDSPDDIFALRRGCYRPGQIEGLNSSNGCRNWTTFSSQSDYTALYCFCDTPLCNAGATARLGYSVLVLMLSVLYGWQRLARGTFIHDYL